MTSVEPVGRALTDAACGKAPANAGAAMAVATLGAFLLLYPPISSWRDRRAARRGDPPRAPYQGPEVWPPVRWLAGAFFGGVGAFGAADQLDHAHQHCSAGETVVWVSVTLVFTLSILWWAIVSRYRRSR